MSDETETVKEAEIIKLITEYRKGKIENIEIEENINAFGYIMPFARSCNLILKKEEKYYLNKSRVNLLDRG